jgi:hypothetical protein
MKKIALLIGILGSGCAAAVGTAGMFYTPKDAALTCSNHCREIRLGSTPCDHGEQRRLCL